MEYYCADSRHQHRPGPILIVGLRESELHYELPRHNVGYLVLDKLCGRTTPSTRLLPNKRTTALVEREHAGGHTGGAYEVLHFYE